MESRIGSGGLTVFGHGFAISTVIDSGGTEFLSGGTDYGGIVGSGGRIVVGSGGTAIDVTISGGGTAIVSAGGLIATDSGGTVTVDGVVINSGAMLASATSSLIDIAGWSAAAASRSATGWSRSNPAAPPM